jgi:fatty-acid desaturase
LQKYIIPIQVVFGFILYFLGGWPWVVWGIFARIVIVFHCTWFVNSATHKFGYKTYQVGDNSTNCWWVALLTYGEGCGITIIMLFNILLVMVYSGGKLILHG